MPNAAKSRALASREKQVQAARLSRMGRTMVLALATILSFATVSLLLVDRLYRPDTFVIDQLKVKGKLRHLDVRQVEELVAKTGVGNFFSIELEKIKAEIEALAWVQNADVRREWPNTLLIEISEHRPVMRWNDSKWLNSYGEVVDLPLDETSQQRLAARAIKLYGRDQDSTLMLNNAYAWKKRLAKDELELRSLELSGSHAWTLGLRQMETDTEFKLLLGREDFEQRLSRFVYLFETHFRNSQQRLQRVDARYPDGLAIKSETIEISEPLAMQSGNSSVVKSTSVMAN